jgi:2-polyprenyl-6-methoxyphenol hydroxylase-like FAD-dependent oxidoreductase
MVEETQVVIVGAGPVGLTLAIDLGQRGVRCLLLERNATTAPYPKMDRSNARTMEIFRRLGCADDVRAVGYPPEASMDVLVVTRLCDPPLVRLYYPSVAERRAEIAACRDGSQPVEAYQLVSQNALEPVLKRVAERTPNVTVRYGCEVTGFEQDGAGVSVQTRTLDGAVGSVRCAYLAGCDGGVSLVRKTLGISLSGQGGLKTLRQVAFWSEQLYEKIPIGKGRHYNFADMNESVIVVQGDRKEFTLHTNLPEDADFETELRGLIGFDVDLKILDVRTWKFHLLLADRYRDGRVFLAGDAAHLVIPTGGLGMNTGVGDAVDLAWKLAGALKGWGGQGLLDSYETERRAIGARNVEAAGWAASAVPIWRALVTPHSCDATPEGEAQRKAITESAAVNQRRMHEMRGAEFGYSYAGSPLIATEADDPRAWDTCAYEPGARPGVRLPHMWLSDGRAIQDVLGAGYTLLDLNGDPGVSALTKAFAATGAPLEVMRMDEPSLRKVYGASVLLLRPDLHVVWRGDALPASAARLADMATGRLVA